MRIVLHILIVLEMIAVNLTTVHLCSKRKRSLPCLTAVLAGFTALLVGVMLLALSRFPDYGNGNGLFVLVGFLYLPVLMWLYGDRFAELLMKMCSTWVYTMLLFSLSVHIAHLFPDEAFDLVAFIAQTGLYLLTLYPFLRFVRKRFLFILQNIPKPASKLLLAESLVWFLTMIVINYTFVQDYRYPFLRVISLLALAANVVVSYTCIQTIVGAQHRIEKLRSIVYIDGLTGLKNRSSLYIDCTNWIESGEPFILIFMDLNRFKEVNDRHGHLAGDEYLVCFSEHLQKLAADDGAVYRLSGDEFVCLYKRPDPAAFLSGLSLLRCGAASVSQPFLGVSAGCAFFPPRRPNPRSAHRRGGQRYVPEQRFRQNVKENASYGIILAHCPVHVFHPACSPRGMERGQYALVARLPSRGGLAGRRASCWMGGAHVDIPGFPHLLRRCRRTAADHLVGRIPYGWVPRRDRRHFFQAGSGP